jgi:hypothetical protein
MTYFDQSNLISQNNLGQISKMATVGSGKFDVTDQFALCHYQIRTFAVMKVIKTCSAAYRETELIFTEAFGFLGFIEKAVINKHEEIL